MNVDLVKFDFLSSRLNFVEVSTDQLMNIDLWHYLSVFESHVYGVFLQYNRIKKDLKFSEPENLRKVPGPQAGLDIYYYTLTWDKLKKIFTTLSPYRLQVPKTLLFSHIYWRYDIQNNAKV